MKAYSTPFLDEASYKQNHTLSATRIQPQRIQPQRIQPQRIQPQRTNFAKGGMHTHRSKGWLHATTIMTMASVTDVVLSDAGVPWVGYENKNKLGQAQL